MKRHHSTHYSGRLLFVACACLAAAPLIGCSAKEEAPTPGYYNGALKGKKAPPPGGDSAPANGKAGND